MRFTCILCTINLILLGLIGGAAALFGVDMLSLIFLSNLTAIRIYLAITSVSALFLIYALLTFRPFQGLK
jgi:hypothetical protein